MSNNTSFDKAFEERFALAKREIECAKREIEESFETFINKRFEALCGDKPCTETPDEIIAYIDEKYEAWLLSERPAQQEFKSDSPNLAVVQQLAAEAQHQVADAQHQAAVHEHSHMQMVQQHQQANQIMQQQMLLLQQQMNNK
jgi:hypothetical protein